MYLTVNQGVLGSTPIAIGARRGAKMKPMKIGFFYGVKSAFFVLGTQVSFGGKMTSNHYF